MNASYETTQRIFDSYERRFAAARLEKSFGIPTSDADRTRILGNTKKMLGWDDVLIPTVRNLREVSSRRFDGYTVTELLYETWDGCYVPATLTMPDGDEKKPLVFLFCGHGKLGRRTASYQYLPHLLARMGIASISPDNIGQGDRERMGHTHAWEPFYAGLTLQGLIVMEAVAIIRHMQKDPRIDASRMGSCGNSGGGTLNLFLAAMAPELSALSASGYPSEFPHIFSKERRHCACNLLPACCRLAEMWEVLSLFAPKPLLLEQGLNDNLFPVDLFYRNARKVRAVYEALGAAENCRHAVTQTLHSWEEADWKQMAAFFGDVFGKPVPEDFEADEALLSGDAGIVTLPEDAIDTAELVFRLTGVRAPAQPHLWDIFPPRLDGRILSPDEYEADLGRGPLMQVFAQMECALADDFGK